MPHPPGYPLHTALSALFVRALPLGTVAWRANLASAVAAAGAVGLLFLVARRLGAARVPAAAAALALAAAGTFWSQAVAAEVYAFDALLFQLALFTALGAGSRRGFVVAGLAAGALVGHRPVNVLVAPVLALLLEDARRRARLPRGAWLAAALAAAASGLVYVLLPIVSRREPALDIGDPETWSRFWTVVSAETYRRHLGSGTAALEAARLGRFLAGLVPELGVAALAGAAGLWTLFRRGERLRAWALVGATLVTVGFACRYNILDIGPYFLPAHAVLAAAAGVGFGLLPGRWRWLALPAVLAALPLHWRANDLGRIRIADGHARAALASAPQGAILLTGGDTSTHALWFVQGTERVRPDVAVVSPGHVSGWHVPQLRRRHPEIAWPADEEIARGTWLATLLRAEVARRPVCLLEPPELRLPGWGAGDLLEAWRGVAEGVLFRLERAERPADRARLARAVEAWRRLSPPGARELADADVQVVMSAFTLAVARFALAGELLEAGDAAEGAAQLRALAAAEPDAMEARMAEAYAAIGRGIPRLRLGARAARALGASGAPAMLAALAPL